MTVAARPGLPFDPKAVAAGVDFGRPSARKTGRNPKWPYVPVLVDGAGRETQVLGLAYRSRDEAVAAAEDHVRRLQSDLADRLASPRHRSLREVHGLPRELSTKGEDR